MALRHFCTVDDVRALNSQAQRNYTDTSNPSVPDVRGFIRQYGGEIENYLYRCGYLVPAGPETVRYTTAPLTVGGNVLLPFPDAGDFEFDTQVRVVGVSNSRVQEEFAEVFQVLPNTGVKVRLRYTYDVTAAVYLVPPPFQYLRRLNALGAAAEAERAVFMSGNANESTHSQVLQQQFDKAVERLLKEPELLHGLDTDTLLQPAFPTSLALSSFGHRSPDDVEPRFEISKGF